MFWLKEVVNCSTTQRVWKGSADVMIDYEHIPKSGGSTWGQLLIRHTLGTFPLKPLSGFATYNGGNWDLMRALGKRTFWSYTCAHHAGKAIAPLVIVRNPYTRLLSGYLDKVARASQNPSWRAALSFRPRRGTAWDATPVAFEDFVEQLLQHVRAEKRIGDVVATTHLLPLTSLSQSRLWPNFGERTLDAAMRRWNVLRLEEMTVWYPHIIRDFDLTSAANDPLWRWSGSRPYDCFWTAPGKSCNESLRISHAYTGPKRLIDGDMCDDRAQIGHGTGACKRLSTFYATERVIRNATDLLASDLKALGYAKMHPLTAV